MSAAGAEGEPTIAAGRARRAAILCSRVVATAVPPMLGALPFLVLFGALVAERPRITAYGDRAVTALAVRDLLHGHQLLGAYSRYGWHHPGPAFFVPLAAAHLVSGGASWALDAGMLIAAAVPAAAVVALVGHRAGWRAGVATAGAVGVYLHAIEPVTLRDPWNPWGLLLPMALLVVLCADAGAGSAASLGGAVLVTTLLVQTHVGAAPVSVALLLTGSGLAWRTWRTEPDQRGRWCRASVLVPMAAAAALWIPPIAEQATGQDPNLSELWRFFIQGSAGHSLSTAVAAVGSRLRLIPFGDQAGLMATSPSVGWDAAGAGLATLVAYSGAGALVAVAGHRWRNRFARSTGILTVVAVWISVVAVRSVQGPLDGFLLAWITAVPLGLVAGAAALLPGRAVHASWRSPVMAGATAVALAFAAVGTTTATVAAADAPSAASEDAPAVRDAWTQLAPHLGSRPGAVLLRVADPFVWPVQAGLVLLVEQHGWQAHVTDDWAFMFGPSRRMTGAEPLVATLRATTPQGPQELLTLDVSATFAPQSPEALDALSTRMATVLGASVLGGFFGAVATGSVPPLPPAPSSAGPR